MKCSGPVTQAIHLPALARLTDLFTVRAVMDVSEATAAEVAARVSARATTSVDDLLQDATVEVVAVCSPHQFHAEQVIAACRAGKRAVLCEKPFATTTDEASRIAQVSVETGVPIIVGEDLAQHLTGFAEIELDRVRVVGRDEPETLFALLGDETTAAHDGFQRLGAQHAAMLTAYRARKWDEAEAALTAGLAEYEAQGLLRLHELFAKRVAALRSQPPGEGWDGVFQATEK